jgi:hypothetical protein
MEEVPMRTRITALVLLAGLATAPAAYGQGHPHKAADADEPSNAGMMQMHEGQSMMHQGGMMESMMASSPTMILNHKETLDLDASQIEQLETLQLEMNEMRQAHMASMKRLHDQALGVLTDDQRSKIESEMSGMMKDGMMMQGEMRGNPCSMMEEDEVGN